MFCRSFVGTYEAFGEVVEVELCEGGKDRMVTNENRQGQLSPSLSRLSALYEFLTDGSFFLLRNSLVTEYVSLLVNYILTDSIAPQFEAFSSGFNEACSGGNALSLFKGEELELLVRGSEEALDVDELRGTTSYSGFNPNDQVIE